MFISGRVRPLSSRVRTRAPCLRPDSWLVEVYCKASSYPLKRDYSWEFFSLHRLTKGFTKWCSCKALTREGGIVCVWWKQKIRLLTFTSQCFWWQKQSVCCCCSNHLKLLPTPTIFETGNYVDAPQMSWEGGVHIHKKHVTVNLYSFYV